MKRINTIESLLSQVMCKDRIRLSRRLRKVKTRLKNGKLSSKALQGNLDAIKAQVDQSIAKKKERLDTMPEIKYDPELPITRKKDEIIHAIRNNRVVIISGETGSGKTTQIPKFCMAAGRGGSGNIGCTQPRRIAAITVAQRIAQELGEPCGKHVGYKIRFDDKSSGDTIVKIMTDGILLAETQSDPFLNDYDTLIIDEAHERSLNIDFALGILRNLVNRRKDLKVIITSATIDTQKFSKAFDDAPVIEVSGRMYPVELHYTPLDTGDTPDPDDQGYVEAAVAAVDNILKQSRQGDILVFMPTEQDISDSIEMLMGRGYPGVLFLPLYARLSSKEQSRVFGQGPGRKVVVSTNVAETSLTIPGITYVVDTGLARIPRYSPRTRTTALPVSPISRSSADQRMGRCGRVANGVCIRLYDEMDYGERPLFTTPELLRSNLAEVILRMIALDLGTVESFPFIDPPSAKSIKDGFETLLELGAIRQSENKKNRKKQFILTDRGRIMARIPVDPKLSRILIEADDRGCLDEAAVIVAALSIPDPRQRPQDKLQQADQKHAMFKDPSSDFLTLLAIWNAYERARLSLKTRGNLRRFCHENFLSFRRLKEWGDIHRQIRFVLSEHGISGEKKLQIPAGTKSMKSKEYSLGGPLYIELHKSLLCGYLANIALKKEKNIYTAAKGKQAMIFPGSGLFQNAGPWIMAAEFVETSQLFARTVANIDPGWLEALAGPLCTSVYFSPRWEKKRGEVVVTEQVSLFGLVIVPERTVAYGPVHPEEAGEIFIRNALVQGEVYKKFNFMTQNQALIDELKGLEDKLRTRDILASEDEIFLFYKSRLDRPFFDIRTFARFLKEKSTESFLTMTRDDVLKTIPDDEALKAFPDLLEMPAGPFKLEYGFDPGADNDGITIKIPAVSAGSVAPQQLDCLVPGLFKEKVTALIRNLPKSHRVKLLPVAAKAEIIASEIRVGKKPLYTALSEFIKKRFNEDIPASSWSDQGLDSHLKMRISIRNDNDEEIVASREKTVLKDFGASVGNGCDALAEIKNCWEKALVETWDFGDLPASIIVEEKNGTAYEVYPALSNESGKVSLRILTRPDKAQEVHPSGVKALYEIVYERDFKLLTKDIRSSKIFKTHARDFGGAEQFCAALFHCLTRELFAKNIRSCQSFLEHGKQQVKTLYESHKSFMASVEILLIEYEKTMEILKRYKLSRTCGTMLAALMEEVERSLNKLVPLNFPELYTPGRIKDLTRYVAALGIRAQRGANDPQKDAQKAARIRPFEEKLNVLLKQLSEESSFGKREAVEEFFWMVEEYKVSLYAQELKTSMKVSPKIMDQKYQRILSMI